jgi:multidrug resistance efflux pump
MTASRWKMLPWVLGVGCLAITLVGAKNLFQPVSPPVQPTVPPARANSGTLGPVVTGVVASEIEVGKYVAPDVLPLAKVKKVLVKPGQDVKVDQPLIEFDSAVPMGEWNTALASVEVAKAKLAQAELQATLFPQTIKSQDTLVAKAELDLKNARIALNTTERLVERTFNTLNTSTGRPWTEAEKEQYRNDSGELLQVRSRVESLKLLLDSENINLAKLKAMNPELAIREAKAEVARIQSLADKAKLIVDACILRSGVDGIVERITVSPGSVVVPQSPEPSVIVIPTGRRLVRAEVVPEFAHKLASSEGRKVVIIDNDNFNLTYEGTVERIGEAFLTRRFAPQDLAALNANRVLECTIHVTDPAPPGKPPLRVGQQVRVSFP